MPLAGDSSVGSCPGVKSHPTHGHAHSARGWCSPEQGRALCCVSVGPSDAIAACLDTGCSKQMPGRMACKAGWCNGQSKGPVRGQGQCATSLKALTTWSRTSALPSAWSFAKRGNGTLCSGANGFNAGRTIQRGAPLLCQHGTARGGDDAGWR